MSHGTRRYGMRREWRRGRWSASFAPDRLNVPAVHVCGEGNPGGTDFAYAAVEYGAPGSDPVLRLEVDLAGTRLGRFVCWLAWQWRKPRWWETLGRIR